MSQDHQWVEQKQGLYFALRVFYVGDIVVFGNELNHLHLIGVQLRPEDAKACQVDKGFKAGKQDQVQDEPVKNGIVQVEVPVSRRIREHKRVYKHGQDQCIDQKKFPYRIHHTLQNP